MEADQRENRSSRRVCFTTFFENVSDESELPENWQLQPDLEDFAGKRICFLVWQLEKCPETGRPHLQGYLELTKKTTWTYLHTVPGFARSRFKSNFTHFLLFFFLSLFFLKTRVF